MIEADEIPGHVRVSNVSLWISLSAVDNIRELHWIPDEEEGSIIANKITDTIFSVELNSEPSRISISIGKSTLSKCGRKSNHSWSTFSLSIQEFGFRPLAAAISQFKVSISARSHCMHHTLWDSLSIKLCKLVY